MKRYHISTVSQMLGKMKKIQNIFDIVFRERERERLRKENCKISKAKQRRFVLIVKKEKIEITT